jgi:uncharacterized protein (DUF1499 family)
MSGSLTRRVIVRVLLGFLLAWGTIIALNMFTSPPSELGVTNMQLFPCPNSPNCVSTQAEDEEHRMPPLPFAGTAESAMDAVKQTLQSMPRMRIVEEQANYLHVESTSLLLRFVDDVEFLFDEKSQLIHFRSASRIGYSDLGANRKRMEKFCKGFERRIAASADNAP